MSDRQAAARDTIPLYEQIQNDIIQKIESGVFGDNQRIPSENELSRAYHVSRITATKALTELSLNGYIYRVQGKGSFVTAAKDRPFRAAEGSPEKPYQVGLLVPNAWDGHGLQLFKGIVQELPFRRFWSILLPSAVSMYNIIIMRTYFQSRIPLELEEAAKVDGCTNFRLLLSIVLPLSIPIIAVIALYYGVGRWNEYFSAMIYITDRKLYPLQLVLREILLQNQASDMMDIVADSGYSDRMMARLGLKYAVIVVSTVPIFVIYPLVQKFFAKGVMVGAIKG